MRNRYQSFYTIIMIAKGNRLKNTNYKDLMNITDPPSIASYYFGIKSFPTLICSPVRHDEHPSVAVLYKNDGDVVFHDFSTGESYTLMACLCQMWGTTFGDTVDRIYNDFTKGGKINKTVKKGKSKTKLSDTKIDVKIRDWRQHDIDYWGQFGITTKALRKAMVFPISHMAFTKDGRQSVIGCHKYAYVYVEKKDGNIQYKIYQPFSKTTKWISKFDKSVISLWNMLPESGDIVVVCSSLKDALTLYCATDIPSIAVQSETTLLKPKIAEELKSRFKKCYVLFDSDDAGIADAIKFSDITGFTNVELPYIDGNEKIPNPKDIAEYYCIMGKHDFTELIKSLLI